MTQTSDVISTLNPSLQTRWEKAGFSKATAVQERVIPLIVEGRDVIAESPTGTGKTLAYLLPIHKNRCHFKALSS